MSYKSIASLKTNIKSLELSMEIIDKSVPDPIAKERIISFVKREIFTDKQKLSNLEYNEVTVLKTKVINGIKVAIPESMHFSEDYDYFYIDKIIYTLQKEVIRADSSFHYNAVAFIPDGKKFVQLQVKLMGNDSYRDRYSVGASYYTSEKDSIRYMHKEGLSDSKKYKPYIDQIIELVRTKRGKPKFLKKPSI